LERDIKRNKITHGEIGEMKPREKNYLKLICKFKQEGWKSTEFNVITEFYYFIWFRGDGTREIIGPNIRITFSLDCSALSS